MPIFKAGTTFFQGTTHHIWVSIQVPFVSVSAYLWTESFWPGEVSSVSAEVLILTMPEITHRPHVFGTGHLDVSENSGWKPPKFHPFVHRVFHEINHPFLGYPYFWKHPFEKWWSCCICNYLYPPLETNMTHDIGKFPCSRGKCIFNWWIFPLLSC